MNQSVHSCISGCLTSKFSGSSKTVFSEDASRILASWASVWPFSATSAMLGRVVEGFVGDGESKILVGRRSKIGKVQGSPDKKQVRVEGQICSRQFQAEKRGEEKVLRDVERTRTEVLKFEILSSVKM